MVMLFAEYGRIRRIRKGWYAALEVHDEVVRAHRVGGRLACFSALAHHGWGDAEPGILHVAVPRSSSRLRSADLPGRPLAETESGRVVIHWNRAPPTGDRQAVSLAEAITQARACGRRTTSHSAQPIARDTL